MKEASAGPGKGRMACCDCNHVAVDAEGTARRLPEDAPRVATTHRVVGGDDGRGEREDFGQLEEVDEHEREELEPAAEGRR